MINKEKISIEAIKGGRMREGKDVRRGVYRRRTNKRNGEGE